MEEIGRKEANNMQFNRCLGCMEEISGYPCPHCGFGPKVTPAFSYALPLGAVLNGHCVVGKVLGQGGFGITYIGFDLNLERKVAIKEFYPKGQVSRYSTTSTCLQWPEDPQSQDFRKSGTESFLREAKKMAKVEDIPEVVRVRECFHENGTAYIVMDYIEGKTLLAALKEKGPMTWEQAKDVFLPAVSAMERVHQAGMIHRDLSPDNLMLTDKGVRILDLGAAKDLTTGSGASSNQVAKSGFSPLEQYTQRGGTGTWSDVYAMAATVYYTLTGVLPPNATDRVEEDTLDWTLLTKRGVPTHVTNALQKAMSITAKGRTQTMAELLKGLEGAPAPQLAPEKSSRQAPPPQPVKTLPAEKPRPQAVPSMQSWKENIPLYFQIAAILSHAAWLISWLITHQTPYVSRFLRYFPASLLHPSRLDLDYNLMIVAAVAWAVLWIVFLVLDRDKPLSTVPAVAALVIMAAVVTAVLFSTRLTYPSLSAIAAMWRTNPLSALLQLIAFSLLMVSLLMMLLKRNLPRTVDLILVICTEVGGMVFIFTNLFPFSYLLGQYAQAALFVLAASMTGGYLFTKKHWPKNA